MKKGHYLYKKIILLMLMGVMCFASVTVHAESETTTETAQENLPEWTVLFYLCGTDLETGGGMASINLKEIMQTVPDGQVNFLMETGGTARWQADELGLDIDEDKLQRYSYSEEGFVHEANLPLKNMANAETLTEFINWGTENYPAKKYMLVAWDHGGGSAKGLIVDELYDNAIMTVEDFGRALRQSNTEFEVVLLDACLMAGIEVAQALQPSAHYLIASEETVPGAGTAYNTWLQQLYDHPTEDGYRFSQMFCDTVEQKYAEAQSTQKGSVTFSALDLSKLDTVNDAYEALFLRLSDLLDEPAQYNRFAYLTGNTEQYSGTYMLDLYDWVRRGQSVLGAEVSENMMDSIKDMVISSVRGENHVYSQGLSFYYNPQDTAANLDHLARSFTSAAYLAYIDRMRSDWTAPEWVYEKITRREDVSRDAYTVKLEEGINEDGEFQIEVTQGADGIVNYTWGLMKAETDEDGDETFVSLGQNAVLKEDLSDNRLIIDFDGKWPMMNDIPVRLELVQDSEEFVLYNVPLSVIMNTADYLNSMGFDIPEEVMEDIEDETADISYDLRMAYMYDAKEDGTLSDYQGHYELLGIWDHGTVVLDVPSRNVEDLDVLYGNQVRLDAVYYIDGLTGLEASNETADFGTTDFDETTTVEDGILPAGDYLYFFSCTDAFGRETQVFADLYWDGEEAVFEQRDFLTMDQVMEQMFDIFSGDYADEDETDMDIDDETENLIELF